MLRAEAEGLADVLGAAGADAAADAAARAQLDAQLTQARRRLAQVRAGQICYFVELCVSAHCALDRDAALVDNIKKKRVRWSQVSPRRSGFACDITDQNTSGSSTSGACSSTQISHGDLF